MRKNINLGAYGWRHPHWSNTFYPEDLPVSEPEDWRLTYYSNEFNTVLVPADYWKISQDINGEALLDAVHEGFEFFIECHVDMLDFISMVEFGASLKALQPQLSALVFLDEQQIMPESIKRQFYSLADSMMVDTFGLDGGSASVHTNIWRVDRPAPSNFAFIENDLTDLRLVKTMVEDFVSQSENKPATIIVDHPRLQASDLSKCRSMLEIMGY